MRINSQLRHRLFPTGDKVDPRWQQHSFPLVLHQPEGPFWSKTPSFSGHILDSRSLSFVLVEILYTVVNLDTDLYS